MTRLPQPDIQIYDGEWINIAWSNQREKCCGCGLVHRIDYRIAPSDKTVHPKDWGQLQFRARQVRR